MRGILGKATRLVCTFALAASLVPALPAAASSSEFVYLGIEYSCVSGIDSTASVTGVADTSVAISSEGILTVPSVVYDEEGTAYEVGCISASAFNSCGNLLRDLRIMGLSGDATVYPQTVEACPNLEVVHFYGPGHFVPAVTLTLGAAVVMHEGSDLLSDAANWTHANEDDTYVNLNIYVSVEFQTSAGESTFVYVNRHTLAEELGNLSASRIYCDAETYAADASLAACPNAAAPALSAGSTWAFVTLDGEQMLAEDELARCGIATEIATVNLDYATVNLATTDFTYDAAAGKDPGVSVTDAEGNLVDASNYCVTYWAGESLESATALASLDEVVDCGTYWALVSGTGSFSGSAAASFTISFVESEWVRANGGSTASTDNLRHLLAYQARAQQANFTASDGSSISTSAVLVVNGDDYASCVLAASLSGLFNCSVITVDENCIRASNGKLTATNVTNYASVLSGKLAIVLGNSEYISDTLYEAVQTTVGDSGKVTRFDTDLSASAAQEAEAVYAMISAVQAGEFDLGVNFESYGRAAMVVPSAGNAAVFSALTYANSNNMAVFFAASDGRVSTQTLEYLAAFDEVVVAGFEASVAAIVQAALPASVAASCWVQSSNVYASAASYAEAAMAAGSNTCSSLAVAPANDYGRLAAVAAQAGFAKATLILADSVSEGQAALTSFVSAHVYEIYTGVVFATYLEIPLETQVPCQAQRMQSSATKMEFATVSGTFAYEYTGSAITPSVTVTAVDGTELTQGEDYLLYYYNSNTAKTYHTTSGVHYSVAMSSHLVVTSTTSTMVEPGTYTVLVQGTYETFGGNMDPVYEVGTCTGYTAFTITIGEADEPADYTAAYAEQLDEADYATASDEEVVEPQPEPSEEEEPSDESPVEASDPSSSTSSEKIAEEDPKASTSAAQKISVKKATKTLKVKKLKKKALTCKFAVKKASTTLVAKAANAKSKKALKVKVSGKSLQITVARGTKKGTYKVKVYAKASANYSKSNTITIVLKVK